MSLIAIDLVRTPGGEVVFTGFAPEGEPVLSRTEEGIVPGLSGERLESIDEADETDLAAALQHCWETVPRYLD